MVNRQPHHQTNKLHQRQTHRTIPTTTLMKVMNIFLTNTNMEDQQKPQMTQQQFQQF